MKEFKFVLVVKGSPEMKVETIKSYIEKYMINHQTLESLKLKSLAGDAMPTVGLDIHSVELKNEREKEDEITKRNSKPDPKRRKSKKPVSTAV